MHLLKHGRLVEMIGKLLNCLMQLLHQMSRLRVLLLVAYSEFCGDFITSIQAPSTCVEELLCAQIGRELVQCAQLEQIDEVEILQTLRALAPSGFGREARSEHVEIALPSALSEASGRCNESA